jgi:hypothetical protein
MKPSRNALRPVLLAIAVVLAMAVCSEAGLNVDKGSAGAASPPEKSRPTAPHEVLDDPPPPPGARDARPRTSPAPIWTRDSFQSIQVNVDAAGDDILGDAANEPSIAVDPTNPDKIVIGWRQFDTVASNFREAGWGYSHDGGMTWTFPGVLQEDVFRSDPVLEADADGNIYYYSLYYNSGSYSCQMFKSTDGGVTWLGPIEAFGGDKAWMAIDRTGGIGHGHIYAAWDYAGCCGNNWFTRSMDGGLSYDDPVPIPQQPIWGVTSVGPNGNVYTAGRRRTTYEEFIVVRSSTLQNPLLPPAFQGAVEVALGGSLVYMDAPNPNGLLGQVWVATDHSDGPSRGNVYLLCSVAPFTGTDPLDVMFARSTDGGLSWSLPIRVNDDPAGTDAWQWFGTMAVAPSGRIDVIFNDTRNTGVDNLSELFYTYSTDTGLTWSENIPISPVFNSHDGWPSQNKLGDYYDMVSDEAGAKVAYAATFNGGQDIYYLRIAIDCNENGIHDGDDLATGTSQDVNNNAIPDECEGLSDLNEDGVVDLDDFAMFKYCLAGPDFTFLPTGCSEQEFAATDLDDDNDVDAFDFAVFALHYTD